jgi:hypothetical protein
MYFNIVFVNTSTDRILKHCEKEAEHRRKRMKKKHKKELLLLFGLTASSYNFGYTIQGQTGRQDVPH